MKKSIFLITILFLVLKTSQAAHEGFGAGGMVIDRESFGGGAHGAIFEGTGGDSHRVQPNFEMGSEGSRTFDIGGMRTLELPTSFSGNIGGRF